MTLAEGTPRKRPDTAYLQYIHRVLFEDIYDWACDRLPR